MNGYHIVEIESEGKGFIVAGINRAEDYVGGRLRMVDSDAPPFNSIKYYDAVGYSFHPEWGGGGCQLIIVDPDKHSDWTETVMLNGNTITEPNNDWTTYMRVNHLPVEDVMFHYVGISEVIEAFYDYNANSKAKGNIQNMVKDLSSINPMIYDNFEIVQYNYSV